MDAAGKAEIEQAVRGALEAYFAAASRANAAEYLALFAADEELSAIENGVLRGSRRALGEYVAESRRAYRFEAALEEARVYALAADAALAVGAYRYRAVKPSGDATEGRNAFSFVYVREAGEWRIKHLHESAALRIEKRSEERIRRLRR